MKLFEQIYKEILNEDNVSVNDIDSAIDNHKRVIINYETNGDRKNNGVRVIEVYAYGLSKTGAPCIRAFQPYGDTTTSVPNWKMFRLDRITYWNETPQTFDAPSPTDSLRSLFNRNGDESMSVVYKIINFDKTISNQDNNSNNNNHSNDIGPKTNDDVYKTDTERGLENLRKQLQNPININDIKKGDAFKQFNKNKTPNDIGPKTNDDVYKTDTERGLENLRKQLQNPRKIDLSQFDKNKQNDKEDLEKLKQIIKDKPISLSDINKKMNSQEDSDDNDIYKTDTERGLENLRKQLQNPRKIDLNNIPKR